MAKKAHPGFAKVSAGIAAKQDISAILARLEAAGINRTS